MRKGLAVRFLLRGSRAVAVRRWLELPQQAWLDTTLLPVLLVVSPRRLVSAFSQPIGPRVVQLLTWWLEIWFPLEIKMQWPQETVQPQPKSPVFAHTAMAHVSFISEICTLRFSPTPWESLLGFPNPLNLAFYFFIFTFISPTKSCIFVFPRRPYHWVYTSWMNDLLEQTHEICTKCLIE